MELPENVDKKLRNAEWSSFEKPAEVALFLYLLHHPDYPKRIADICQKVEIDKEGLKSLKSLCKQSHVNRYLLEMKKKGLVYEAGAYKKKGRKHQEHVPKQSTRAFYINPYLLAAYKGKQNLGINTPFATALADLIIKISKEEEKTIGWIIASYQKFDFATILIHLQLMLTEIINYMDTVEKYSNYKSTDEKMRAKIESLIQSTNEYQEMFYLNLAKVKPYLEEKYKNGKPRQFYLKPKKTLEDLRKGFLRMMITDIWAERIPPWSQQPMDFF